MDNDSWGVALHLGDLGLAVIVVVAAVALLRPRGSAVVAREPASTATMAAVGMR